MSNHQVDMVMFRQPLETTENKTNVCTLHQVNRPIFYYLTLEIGAFLLMVCKRREFSGILIIQAFREKAIKSYR